MSPLPPPLGQREEASLCCLPRPVARGEDDDLGFNGGEQRSATQR